MKIQAEIVNGKCPTCEEITMLVGLTSLIYRCLSCGTCLLYTSPSPRDAHESRMPSSA